MSFSFSQNLLSDLSSSQSSQSDSLPPTQPMIRHNWSTTNTTRQNFTLPRPPSCPNMNRPVSSQEPQRAKYTRQENSSDKTSLGQTLKEVQAGLNSVPSTFSRMLEEALVYLETMITKEKEMTSNKVKSVNDDLEKVIEEVLKGKTVVEEESKKASASVEMSLKLMETLTNVLSAVDADQKKTVKVVQNLEEKLDKQIRINQKLLEDFQRLNYSDQSIRVDNMRRMVRLVAKEELEALKGVQNQAGEYDGRRPARFERQGANTDVTPVRSTVSVRNSSLANKKVQDMVDFSVVMEIDEDEDEDEVGGLGGVSDRY
eukprot:GFUD01024293.1.p1 GENE.GFUD01024293.1~~GFUD01024293.1.p1  ORF type:complete len:315 (+),score=111.23 GFUD01024293.1:132-1076(+)